jgi:hypothetical protein
VAVVEPFLVLCFQQSLTNNTWVQKIEWRETFNDLDHKLQEVGSLDENDRVLAGQLQTPLI